MPVNRDNFLYISENVHYNTIFAIMIIFLYPAHPVAKILSHPGINCVALGSLYKKFRELTHFYWFNIPIA
jgi:hypothetical protein